MKWVIKTQSKADVWKRRRLLIVACPRLWVTAARGHARTKPSLDQCFLLSSPFPQKCPLSAWTTFSWVSGRNTTGNAVFTPETADSKTRDSRRAPRHATAVGSRFIENCRLSQRFGACLYIVSASTIVQLRRPLSLCDAVRTFRSPECAILISLPESENSIIGRARACGLAAAPRVPYALIEVRT